MQSWEAKKHSHEKYDVAGMLNKYLTKSEIRHIKFNYFKRGVLSIVVDSSGWLYQMNLKKDQLLSGLRENLTEIKDIRFRVG